MRTIIEKSMKLRTAILASAIAVFAPLAHGDGRHQHKDKDKAAAPVSTAERAFGRVGDPKKVSRTVDVDMNDEMRFTPAELAVRQGDTIRFRVKNSGKVMHEMVLGTMTELKKHAEMMRKHSGMAHDQPYMVHVAPGKTGTMTWQFTKAGEFHYGCLVPGHLEAGMTGRVKVAPLDESKHNRH